MQRVSLQGCCYLPCLQVAPFAAEQRAPAGMAAGSMAGAPSLPALDGGAAKASSHQLPLQARVPVAGDATGQLPGVDLASLLPVRQQLQQKKEQQQVLEEGPEGLEQVRWRAQEEHHSVQ